MAKAVILNSGGLDSALVAKYASQNLGHELHSLFIQTGLINDTQTMAAATTTASNYCQSHKIISIDLGRCPNHWESRVARENMDASSLLFYTTDPPVRYYDTVSDPTATYLQRPWNEFRGLPNQAMMIYSIGASYAKIIGATVVISGARLTQDEQYELNFDTMADMSRLRVSRPRLKIPFAASTTYREAAILLVGLPLTQTKINALRAEFAYTYSCRWPIPCGICEKCTGRANLGLT